MLDIGRYFVSTLVSDPPFFKPDITTACFMGAGNTVDDCEAVMIRANRGERASMRCFTSDVRSGSSSHDFVADASGIFTHPKVTQVQTHRSAYSQLLACRQLAAEINYDTAPLSFLWCFVGIW